MEEETPLGFGMVRSKVGALLSPQVIRQETRTCDLKYSQMVLLFHPVTFFFMFLFTDESVFSTNFWISSHHF